MPIKTKRIATGIIEISNPDKNQQGVFARIQRAGKPHRKFFSYSKHGGKDAATKKAHEFIRERRSVLPKSRGNKDIKSVRNTSGKVGVHVTQGASKRWPGCYSYAYVAGWRDPNGKHRHVSFALEKYGERAAWKLACIARDNEITDRDRIFEMYAAEQKKRSRKT